MTLSMAFETIGQTDVGQEREHNEDSILTCTVDGWTVLAVADGMGGHAAGDVASHTALKAFETHLDEATWDDPEEVLRAAIHSANEAVHDAGDGDGTRDRMGTTLVTALVSGDDVLLGNVGDSRAYEITDGSIEQLTVDQSLVQELLDQGAISPDEVDDHPQRHVLSQALGTTERVEPDISQHVLSGTLLVCSDGLTEEVSDATIANRVAKADSLETAAEDLIETANANGGSDNISIVLGQRT